MKKVILSFLLFITYTQLISQTPTKLYINFVIHNEGDYSYTASSYSTVRDQMIQFTQLCQSKNAKWHHQSDYRFLEAAIAYDNGSVTSNTNGKNILQYLTETYPSEFKEDPHSHEEKYNYADIAYMMSSLGIDPGITIGGALFDTVIGKHNWENYQNPVAGWYYPSYSWAPEIFWGPASPGHKEDADVYGVWKPSSMNDFFTHDPNKHLILCGIGCRLEITPTTTVSEALSILTPIVTSIQNGNAPSNGIYAANIFFQESCFNNSTFLNTTLPELIDSINQYVSKGQMEWMFIHDIISKWKTDYASEACQLACDSLNSNNSSVSYCESKGQSTQLEYLNSITFNSKTNTSGNDKGYKDFTSISFSVANGKSYSISLKPGFAFKAQKEYYTVWIDFNQDGDFDDSGEQVCKGTSSMKMGLSSNITIPSSANSGNVRMRVSMKYGGYPTSCEVFSRGEVEDYTLSISSSSTNLMTNTNEINSSEAISIYPNPANENILIELTEENNTSITLVDTKGKIVYMANLQNSDVTHKIDLTKIPQGLYFLSIQSSKETSIHKLMINH